MADQMKKNGGYIPGIRPGKPTATYLTRVMTRITLTGAIFLAVISILPVFFGALAGFACNRANWRNIAPDRYRCCTGYDEANRKPIDQTPLQRVYQ